jgi:hypothetical protein
MDRELLELAAKAAGIEGNQDVHGIWTQGSWEMGGVCWNPRTDDGDALRLAVKLKIPMQFPDWENMTRTWGSKNCLDAFNEPHGTDPLAATRRAITRAAAEIGRSMK